MTTEEFDKVATEIRGRRRVGKVWIKRVALKRRTTETAQARADALVTSLDLTPITTWTEMSRSKAEQGATSILHRDLAYDAEIMPVKDASRLAKGFLGFFTRENGDDVKYFTNGTLISPARENGRGWSGITGATFDCGIIVVAENSVGILWVADED